MGSGAGGAHGAAVQLTTGGVRVCAECGAGHFDDSRNACRGCGASLDGATPINGLYRIENVDTQPVTRITANDEERQRQAFELQTVFRWAVRGGRPDARAVRAADDADEAAPDPERTPPQRIVPYVEDQKNALHLMPAPGAAERTTDRTLATLQHALRRGLERHYQLEEGELLVEPLPWCRGRR